MADTTVFNKSDQVSPQQVPQAPQEQPPAQMPVTPPATFQSPLYEQPLYDESPPPPLTTPPPSPPQSGKKLPRFHMGTILRVVIGFGVFLAVITGIVLLISSRGGSGAKITLTYWGLWEDNNTMQGIISDFEKQNPNIIINYSKQDIHQYKQRLETRLHDNAKDAPDIFRYHSSWTVSLRGDLSPLPESVISKSDLQKNFYPAATKDIVTQDGGIYGIPLEIDTLALFVNTDMFAKEKLQPPTDIEQEFFNTAHKLTKKDETTGDITQSGAAIGSYDFINHAPDILALLFAQQGVDTSNITKNQSAVSSALLFYTQFVTSSEAVWSDKLGKAIDAFAGGKVAMYFGYSWDIPIIQAANKDLHFAVVPAPKLLGKNISIASYWVEGVSVKSLHQKEAMLFMHYLAQKETEQKLYTQETKTRPIGEPYARVDLADTLKSNQYVYPFVQQGQNALSSIFAADTYDDGLNGQANQLLQKAVNGMLNSQDSASPQTAAQGIIQGIGPILTQYGY